LELLSIDKKFASKKRKKVQKGKFYYVNHKCSRIAKRKYNNEKRRENAWWIQNKSLFLRYKFIKRTVIHYKRV